MGYGCGCFPGFCECRDSVVIPTGLSVGMGWAIPTAALPSGHQSPELHYHDLYTSLFTV